MTIKLWLSFLLYESAAVLLYACSELLPSQKGQYSNPTIILLSALAKSLTFLTNAKLRRPSLFHSPTRQRPSYSWARLESYWERGRGVLAELRTDAIFPKTVFTFPRWETVKLFALSCITLLYSVADQKSGGGIWNLLFEFQNSISKFKLTFFQHLSHFIFLQKI